LEESKWPKRWFFDDATEEKYKERGRAMLRQVMKTPAHHQLGH